MKKIPPMILLMLISQPLLAMPWASLKTEIHAAESGNKVNSAIVQQLSEIIHTIVIYTKAQASKDKSSLLFCPPKDKNMHIDELTSMIRAHAKKTNASDNEPVQRLLLQALQAHYPCKPE